MDIDIAKLWDTHHEWGQDVWIKQKHHIDQTTTLVESYIRNIYFTYSYTQADNLNRQQLSSIETAFQSISAPPAIFLNETQQKNHMPEFLVRQGYQLGFNDSWMIYNPLIPVELQSDMKVKDIDFTSFQDFSAILSVVFSEFPENSQYLEICKKSLSVRPNNSIKDFTSTFFAIYDNGVPASGAGMFYSLEANFAYLHNAGTLESYRGKGYQTALIKHRVHLAQSLGINRIYSCVTQGSVSWTNMIKCGFDKGQNFLLFTKKPTATV